MALEALNSARSGLAMAPRALAGFLIATMAVAIIAVLSFTTLQSTRQSSQILTRTVQVLGHLQSLVSILKDAETGQRGFLLTGDESYLQPYVNAEEVLPGELRTVRELLENDAEQRRRLDALELVTAEKMSELASTIVLRREGKAEAALAIVRTDRGKFAMDRIRALVAELEATESRIIAQRAEEWRMAAAESSAVTWGGAAVLMLLIVGAATIASRDFRARQLESWLRTGLLGLNDVMRGDQPLDRLGAQVLTFLATFLDAQVGALFIADSGYFRRVAGYALPVGDDRSAVRPGDGLLGQAARDNRPLRVRDVPPGYLPIASGVGTGTPSELLIAPAAIDGMVHAIVELGFFGHADSTKQDFLVRAVESIAVAVRASKDRSRLEDLLQETQRQAEELQTREEELRVNNEELEEQSRTLKESRAQLESQQAELEQINSQLEEQAQTLEHQKDQLTASHGVLTAKAAELERANDYKSEFLANMSHELRTPLNSTLILSKLLADNKDGNLTEQQVKFAQTICSAGNDLLVLINDVLDLSRIEAGKIDLVPESVAIAASLDGLAKFFAPAASIKGIAFSMVVDPATPTHFVTDAQRFGQILKNLLSNALKFTEKGAVTLQVASPTAGSIEFAVRDTGVGIQAHQRDVIFEAFRQADGSIHRKYGGTGLGLSISRDLAHLLGGSIKVDSQFGRGSVFTLTLPTEFKSGTFMTKSVEAATVSAEETVRALPKGPRELGKPELADDREAIRAGSRLILIVEDDLAFAGILVDLVHEMEFQCIVTHTAGDGLLAAIKYRPSGILLDINLPDFSGLGVLDQLKRDPRTRHIPVHVASIADYRREALELGAVGYALKPVKREELIGALQRVEFKLSQSMRRVLIVEDDPRQRESIRELLSNGEVEIVAVETAGEALAQLKQATFDCMVMDFNLPDYSGYDLLEKMAQQEDVAFPPVIVYTGRVLSQIEEQRLRRYSKSIIIKDARSPERLLDEVTLFLHQVESKLPPERQQMLKTARHRETSLEGRRILVVEDDVRNIFALSSVLEPKGAKIEIARNGREALDALARSLQPAGHLIDMVLMDIMMPEMDGFTAMREIRKHAEWKKLPIIALTAKAMKDDQEKCVAAGANDYIAKPLDVEKLLSLVRVWMPK